MDRRHCTWQRMVNPRASDDREQCLHSSISTQLDSSLGKLSSILRGYVVANNHVVAVSDRCRQSLSFDNLVEGGPAEGVEAR